MPKAPPSTLVAEVCFWPFIFSLENSFSSHYQIGSKFLATRYSKFCGEEVWGWREGQTQKFIFKLQLFIHLINPQIVIDGLQII